MNIKISKKAEIVFNISIISILCSITLPAYAYLDSGTGSMIIQILFAGVAGLLAIVKLYWEKVKNGCKRLVGLFKSKPKTLALSKDDKKDDDKTR